MTVVAFASHEEFAAAVAKYKKVRDARSPVSNTSTSLRSIARATTKTTTKTTKTAETTTTSTLTADKTGKRILAQSETTNNADDAVAEREQLLLVCIYLSICLFGFCHVTNVIPI